MPGDSVARSGHPGMLHTAELVRTWLLALAGSHRIESFSSGRSSESSTSSIRSGAHLLIKRSDVDK
jgi:hypothetical protein